MAFYAETDYLVRVRGHAQVLKSHSMKKLALLFSCLPLLLQAQNFHFGLRAGFTGYQGDLKRGILSQMSFMGSIGAHYDLSEHISARSYVSMGKLKGDDSRGTASMRLRNLDFQSKILDWELGAQYNI